MPSLSLPASRPTTPRALPQCGTSSSSAPVSRTPSHTTLPQRSSATPKITTFRRAGIAVTSSRTMAHLKMPATLHKIAAPSSSLPPTRPPSQLSTPRSGGGSGGLLTAVVPASSVVRSEARCPSPVASDEMSAAIVAIRTARARAEAATRAAEAATLLAEAKALRAKRMSRSGCSAVDAALRLEAVSAAAAAEEALTLADKLTVQARAAELFSGPPSPAHRSPRGA